MSKTYRVGIIGCGVMGRSHSNAYARNPRTTLVAAMDRFEESARNLAEEFSIPSVYTDYDEMLSKEELDIVSIATWQSVCAEITIAAAEAGVKGILSEKPMSASLGEADDMIEACERNGALLAIGHHGRFDPIHVHMRKLVAEGAIGQPKFLYSTGVAGLLNRGTHAIDYMRYILRDPETLWVIGNAARKTDKWERRVHCEDLCMGLICFEDGTRGIYESELPEPAVSAVTLSPTIYGTEGQIKIRYDSRLQKPKDDVILLLNNKSMGWQEIQARGDGRNQFQELIDWMEGKIEEHRGSGRQARYTMEIMMAIYESLRIKGVVEMPLQTRENPLTLMVEDGTLPVLKSGRYDIRAAFPEQTAPLYRDRWFPV